MFYRHPSFNQYTNTIPACTAAPCQKYTVYEKFAKSSIT